MSDLKQAAEKLITIFENRHKGYEKVEYAVATPEDFKDLDIRYYNNIQQELESLGFIHIVDFEIFVSSLNAYRVLQRMMISKDHQTTAIFFNFKNNNPLLSRILGFIFTGKWLKNSFKVVTFGNEFSNGFFINTSNAELSIWEYPPEVLNQYLPYNTLFRDVLNHHRERTNKFMSDNPHVKPIAFSSYQEVFDSSAREAGLMYNFLSKRVITKKEFFNLAKGMRNVPTEQLWKEVLKLRPELAANFMEKEFEPKSRILRKLNRDLVEKDPGMAWDQFVDLVCMTSYEDLMPDQKDGFHAFWYNAEVMNGGHLQYFENKELAHIDEVIIALEHVGAFKQRDILKSAVEIYRSHQGDIDGDKLNSCDDDFFACVPSLDELLGEYLVKNKERFLEIS